MTHRQENRHTTAHMGNDSACDSCRSAVASSRNAIYQYAHAAGRRSLTIVCACNGRTPKAVYEHRSDQLQAAASLAKLAWVSAAITAHNAGDIDLAQPVPHGELTTTRHRDIANVLDASSSTPQSTLLGIGLATSSNAIFDHLSRDPAVRANTINIAGVRLTSGFSDQDLDSLIHTNLITGHAAVSLLLEVSRCAEGVLAPIRLGLANSTRTGRLVRDIGSIAGLPDGLVVANKTGTLTGVRNDAALISNGESSLAVCALSEGNSNTSATDNEMAHLGRALAHARFSRKHTGS